VIAASRDVNSKEKLPKEMAMKIIPNPRIGKAYLRPPPVTQRKTSISRAKRLRKDEFSMSSRAAEVQRIAKLADDVPDVRQERIDAIKKQIKAGKYSVPASAVAKSIINLHLEITHNDEP
jgi:flagellar biosynthesis anti-sigma factor FlgM